jgi:hypothetical protein
MKEKEEIRFYPPTPLTLVPYMVWSYKVLSKFFGRAQRNLFRESWKLEDAMKKLHQRETTAFCKK